MRVHLWDLPEIQKYRHILIAYEWCCLNLGPPGVKWAYGRELPGFAGSHLINSIEEIQYIDFDDEADALIFKLRFS